MLSYMCIILLFWEAFDMINVIMGRKGTGKSKRIIEMANQSLNEEAGDIVFINSSNRHMYDLNHKIRFIDTSEFEIDDYCAFYGFVCGIISEDFDISKVYIDSIYDIVNGDHLALEKFITNIEKVAKRFNIKFVIVIDGEQELAPAFLKECFC